MKSNKVLESFITNKMSELNYKVFDNRGGNTYFASLEHDGRINFIRSSREKALDCLIGSPSLKKGTHVFRIYIEMNFMELLDEDRDLALMMMTNGSGYIYFDNQETLIGAYEFLWDQLRLYQSKYFYEDLAKIIEQNRKINRMELKKIGMIDDNNRGTAIFAEYLRKWKEYRFQAKQWQI